MLYPSGFPKITAPIKTLVSISHWGVFDIAPFGAIISRCGEVEWFENCEPLPLVECDTYEFMQICRPVSP